MRLGVYGGTFDPVHNGHLTVAERVSARFRFDRLLFVPATVPPHKRGRDIAPAAHRVAMLALAMEEHDDWAVSTVEIDCAPPHYSVDTVAALASSYRLSEPPWFIIGADSFEDLPLWHDYLRLIDSCHIIVTARPGYQLDAAHLAVSARARIVDLRNTSPDGAPPRAPDGETKIFLTDDTFVDVSATTVRARSRTGEPLDGLVPPSVARYILKQELYATNHDEYTQ